MIKLVMAAKFHYLPARSVINFFSSLSECSQENRSDFIPGNFEGYNCPIHSFIWIEAVFLIRLEVGTDLVNGDFHLRLNMDLRGKTNGVHFRCGKGIRKDNCRFWSNHWQAPWICNGCELPPEQMAYDIWRICSLRPTEFAWRTINSQLGTWLSLPWLLS